MLVKGLLEDKIETFMNTLVQNFQKRFNPCYEVPIHKMAAKYKRWQKDC